MVMVKGRAKNMGCSCTKNRAVGRIVMLEREIEELAERGCQDQSLVAFYTRFPTYKICLDFLGASSKG